MKSGKRLLFYLLPVALYLVGFLCSETDRSRDLSVPAAVERTRPATVEELRVDLNQVDYEELSHIPGIGAGLAQQILSYRQDHGGFRSVMELDRIPGIGEKKLKLLMDYVYVEE